MRLALKLGLVVVLIDGVQAQPGRLTLTSEPPGAEVYIDSLFVGNTPIHQREMADGLHHLRVVSPSARAWNAVEREETLRVTQGEEVRKTYELGRMLYLNSVPYGARVFHSGVELGVTPLWFRTANSMRGEMTFLKDGFDVASRDVAEGSGTITLKRVGLNLPNGSELEFGPAMHHGSLGWAAYSSAALMVASGVAAAYFKDQANRDFDRFLATNDPSLSASTRRNDRRSAVSLAITQVSFGVLVYLLLSE